MRRLFGSTIIRTAVVAALVAAVVAFPLGVLANHQFTDVPNSYTFHGDIDHVYDARITNGCSATKYCPEDNVTRGQMAAFLERTGGRVTSDDGFGALTGTPTTTASVTIRAGNVTGGTAFVLLQATGYAYTSGNDETGCNAGCRAVLRIYQGASPVSTYGATVMQNTSATIQELGSLTVSTVVAIPTGVNTTFDLKQYEDLGAGTLYAVTTFVATYFPFGGTGGNTLASGADQPVVVTEVAPTTTK